MSKSHVYDCKLCCTLCRLCVLGRPRLARDQSTSSAGNWNVSEHSWDLITVNTNIHLAASEQEGVEEKMQNTNSKFVLFDDCNFQEWSVFGLLYLLWENWRLTNAIFFVLHARLSAWIMEWRNRIQLIRFTSIARLILPRQSKSVKNRYFPSEKHFHHLWWKWSESCVVVHAGFVERW